MYLSDGLFDVGHLDAGRYAFEQHVDTFFEDSPRTPKDENADQNGYDGIRNVRTSDCKNNAGNDNSRCGDGIANHMHVCTTYVEVVLSVAFKPQTDNGIH